MVKAEHAKLKRQESESVISLFLRGRRRLTLALNALKSGRSASILGVLADGELALDEIQTRLASEGLIHGRSAVAGYLSRLISAELVEFAGGRYRLASNGLIVTRSMSKRAFPEALSGASSCNEEIVLIALRNGYSTSKDIASLVNPSVLRRTLARLRRNELIRVNRPSEPALYTRVGKRLYGGATPIERKVFAAIHPDGTSARQVASKVGISLRRTHRFIAMLMRRRAIFPRNIPVTYELTETGDVHARLVDEVARAVLRRSTGSWIVSRLSEGDEGTEDDLEIIRRAGEHGILQSDLWRRLRIDSRKGSRRILSLEKKALIHRRKELERGRWTYRIFAKQRLMTADSLMGIPCAGCEDDFKGSCPTDDLNPEVCARLGLWVSNIGDEGC